MIEDWFEPLRLVEERIRAQIPALTVYTLADIEKVNQGSIHTPCVCLSQGADRVTGQAAGGGAVTSVVIPVVVTLVTDCARDPLYGSDTQETAGRIIAAVITALAGHRLKPGWQPIKRAASPEPDYQGTRAYYRFIFEVQFTAS